MKTCDKYDIDRFLSSATLCPRFYPRGYAANLSLRHIYSVISFRGVLALCTGHHQQQQQHRQQQRHPHNFFCHQIYHQPSKVSTCVCVCVRGSWGVIFGQPPAEEAEKLGLICDKVRVALAVGKGKRGMIAACPFASSRSVLCPAPAPATAMLLFISRQQEPKLCFPFHADFSTFFLLPFSASIVGFINNKYAHTHTHIDRHTSRKVACLARLHSFAPPCPAPLPADGRINN